jgi:hypothetical protein
MGSTVVAQVFTVHLKRGCSAEASRVTPSDVAIGK